MKSDNHNNNLIIYSLLIIYLLTSFSFVYTASAQYGIDYRKVVLKIQEETNQRTQDLSLIGPRIRYSSNSGGFNLIPYLILDGIEILNLTDLSNRYALSYSIPFINDYSNNLLKFGFNFSNIPPALTSRISAIQLFIESDNVEVINQGYCLDECIEYPLIIIDDIYRLDFSDILFNYSVGIVGQDILLTGELVRDGSIFIDPTVTIQDADTENLGDTYVNSQLNSTNYGAMTTVQIRSGTDGSNTYVRRGYFLFNISEAVNYPNLVSIDNMTFFMNHTARGVLNYDAILNLHWVNNTVWNESSITFSNQPCGGNEYYPYNASCGGVVDSVEVDEAGGLNRWFGWNITALADNYNVTDNRLSFVVRQNDTPTFDSYKGFASKEYAFSTERPYIEIELTVSTATTTTTGNTNNDILLVQTGLLIVIVFLLTLMIARRR